MAYTAHWEEHGAYCVYEGVLTNDQIVEADREVVNHPDFHKFRYGIADFSRVEKFEMNSEAVLQSSGFDRANSPTNPDFRVAIIATATVMKGFARMWEQTGGGEVWETKIFEDIETARAWLDT